MKKLKLISFLLVLLALTGNAWAGGRTDNNAGGTASGNVGGNTGGTTGGISLLEAIEQSADRIAAELPPGSRVAVMDFEAGNDRLSDFIKTELRAALIERRIEVVARHSIEYIEREMDSQMSGYVSDETALSIGKFVAAELLVTGQLTHLGSAYRFTATATRVQEATHVSAPRFEVRDDRAMRDMIAALGGQPVVAETPPAPTEVAPPQSAGTFLDRGILFAMRGDYDRAIADFSEAIRINPSLFGAYMLRGRALMASVSRVIGVNENFSAVTTSNVIGQMTSSEQAQIIDRAIADYTQAIRLDPNNYLAYTERGQAYQNKGDYDRAIADYTQVIKLNPNYAVAYNNRGNAYNNKGDYDNAIADLNQALRLTPNNAMAYSNRGVSYYSKGDFNRAIADFNQAIRLNPNLTEAYNSRGGAYYRNGDNDRAIADFDQVIRLDPNFATGYNNRAFVFSMSGNFDRAIADYEASLRIDPNDSFTRQSLAAVLNNRGVAYYNNRDFDRAIADFEAALRANPNHANARQNLDNARQQRGR